MQNSLKAYVLYPLAERFLKRDIRSKLSTLRKEHTQSLEIRQDRQKKQLHQILTTAKAKVPYYRDLFASIHFSPDKVLKSAQYLEEVPLLDKEILREQGIRLINEDFVPTTLHVRKTNGSTGLTTNIFYDQNSLDWTAAANLYASELGGRKLSATEAHLVSIANKKVSWRASSLEQLKCLALNRVNIYTHNFDEKSLLSLLDEVASLRPFSVYGHPSTVFAMAVEAAKHGKKYFGIFSCFEPTGESLDTHKVNTIEKAFGCKVFNRYGNAEFGVIAHSEESPKKLRVLDYLVYPESHSLGNGLEELIFTGLTNVAMPLIRYKTGDLGEVSNSEHFEITNLNGRVHDVVRVENRLVPTSFIKDVMDSVGGVDEFQIVERSDKSMILKIVAHDEAQKGFLEQSITKNFGSSFKIEYTNFDGLILSGWRDKFRHVVRG